MMDRKRMILLMALMWFSTILLSQSLTIKGVVTSSDDGGTLPGVTIKVNERSAGTVTDVNGKYTINVNQGESLSFSFVGFETFTMVIKESRTLDVVLKSKAAQLSEVVVTGLGIKRQQRELGYSTEKINNEELIRASSSNVISAITGKAAGVLVSNNDGVDGGT
ncbi:MAG TPA: carboxypeptidase-like regulatory domain-containing protein, partial [Bacteroidales bacterium]|nr:carboxypeptidase-like regulatory domain-containing protein [Bacteroidales bacterium]